MEQKTVAVLGAGAWGTALALVLAQNNDRVHLWEFNKVDYIELTEKKVSRYLPKQTLPNNIIPFLDLTAAIENVSDVLMVVPSHVFEATLLNLKLSWKPSMNLAWATKGLVPPNQLAHEVVERVLGKEVKTAVLTGPTFANEVAEALPSSILVASANRDFAESWKKKLVRPYFQVSLSDDIVGAQIAGVVKNVLAIAIGMSDGLGYGANTRCALMTRGLNEMIQLGQAMGAKLETFLTVAGIGDLILTCTDNQSRNRRFGLALGQGQSIEEAKNTVGLLVEGYHNTRSLYELAKVHDVSLPLIEKMYDVLMQGLPAKEAIKAWWN